MLSPDETKYTPKLSFRQGTTVQQLPNQMVLTEEQHHQLLDLQKELGSWVQSRLNELTDEQKASLETEFNNVTDSW
jgi:hypothetical protein